MPRYLSYMFSIYFICTSLLYGQAPTITNQVSLKGSISFNEFTDVAINQYGEFAISGYRSYSYKEVFLTKMYMATFTSDGLFKWEKSGYESPPYITMSLDLIQPYYTYFIGAYTVGNNHQLVLLSESTEKIGRRVLNYEEIGEGNHRITGITITGNTSALICRDRSILKMNLNEWGAFEGAWTKNVTDEQNIWLQSVDTLTDGIVTAGILNSGKVSYDLRNDSTDIYVCKLDKNGVKIWEKTLETKRREVFSKVLGMGNGEMIILGETYSDSVLNKKNHGKTDVLLQRRDKNGNVLWTKLLGGSDEEHSIGMLKDENNGCIILASTSSNDGDVSKNKGKSDIWLININEEGEIVWEKTYGTSVNDSPKKLMKNSSGEIVVFSSAGAADGDFSVPKEKWGYYWILTFALPVGVQDAAIGVSCSIKPNPAQNEIVVSGLNEKVEKISITTLLGESILEVPTDRMPTVSISTNNLSNGVYMIHVGNNAEKLIIQR